MWLWRVGTCTSELGRGGRLSHLGFPLDPAWLSVWALTHYAPWRPTVCTSLGRKAKLPVREGLEVDLRPYRPGWCVPAGGRVIKNGRNTSLPFTWAHSGRLCVPLVDGCPRPLRFNRGASSFLKLEWGSAAPPAPRDAEGPRRRAILPTTTLNPALRWSGGWSDNAGSRGQRPRSSLGSRPAQGQQPTRCFSFLLTFRQHPKKLTTIKIPA